MLERDITKLENVKRPFPRITYREAIELLKSKGMPVEVRRRLRRRRGDRHRQLVRPAGDGHPLPGGDQGVLHAARPERSRGRAGLDMLAPEGYGEIIGGSQRIHDHDLLLQRIKEHNLPIEAFQWYLDVRKYGTFPHSGFGMGIERSWPG